jgi:hypothetical protein
MPTREEQVERIQRIIARTIATNPAGLELLLIGGFRYRLLDGGARLSVDIDYHCETDLEKKRQEVLNLCRRTVLGEVRRQLKHEGSANVLTGAAADSPNLRGIELRFWGGGSGPAIEIPVELTRIERLDDRALRTADGILYATASDADLIESKLLAVLNRIHLEHRDLMDILLHADKLLPESPARLKEKLGNLQLSRDAISRRRKDLEEHPGYHVAVLQRIIDTQLDGPVAAQLNASGGGEAAFRQVMAAIRRNLGQ